MKKILSIIVLALLTTIASAQITKTINVATPGTLTTLLTTNEKTTVTNFTVTGNIDTRDVKCMRDEMTVLAVLDLSAVSIKAYNGSDGTNPYENFNYPANEMPSGSFYFIKGGDTGKITLVTIIFPTNLTSIGAYAFTACYGLTSLNFPAGLTSIGNSAFAACYHIPILNLPEGITSLPESVFYNCSGITTLTLPTTLSKIGYGVFYGCSGIKVINCLNPIPPVLGTMGSFGYVSPTDVYVPATSVFAYKAAPEWSSFNSVIKANNTSSTFDITVRVSTGGVVTGNGYQLIDGDVVTVLRNTSNSVTFILTPIPGHEIASLLYNNIEVKSQLNNNQFISPVVDANVTLNVTFQKIQYRLSIKSAESGTINWLCEYGTTASYDFTPSAGWIINTVIYNDFDVTNSLVNGVYTIPAITNNGLLSVSFVNISGAQQLINSKVKVYTTQSDIIIEGTSKGETVGFFTANGKQIQSVKSQGERMVIPAQRNALYLVRIGLKTYKVIL